jgi:hypothetical protein
VTNVINVFFHSRVDPFVRANLVKQRNNVQLLQQRVKQIIVEQNKIDYPIGIITSQTCIHENDEQKQD